jgi:hypothetical protein
MTRTAKKMLTVMGMLLRKRLILPDIGRELWGRMVALTALLKVVVTLELLAVRSFGLGNIVIRSNVFIENYHQDRRRSARRVDEFEAVA